MGNICSHQWGYNRAVIGKGVKVKCECCEATVNQTGITKRHQETITCRNRRDTASNISTSAGSEK